MREFKDSLSNMAVSDDDDDETKTPQLKKAERAL
jgi:hypothetical protein